MHERFHYHSLEEVLAKAQELNVTLPFAEKTDILASPLDLGGLVLANRLGTAPMEGADSLPDGSPSEYTTRRYVKNAEGGSAILWYEAISIVPEARSSATQLLIDRNNVDAFKRLNDQVREAGLKKNGFAPYLVMQANHSGRYSNPDGKPAPLIAYRHPELEKYRPADDSCIVTDDYLKSLEEKFGESALLAKEAGFDAVDIKSCHGYLLAELCSAYTRPGLYGGSYENRVRLLKNGIRAAKPYETSDFKVTARIGIYDGYPLGPSFGSNPQILEEGQTPVMDLAEPIRLIRELHEEEGLTFVDLTMGNPYVTTHVTRPYDAGKYPPEEHPFEGLSRMIHGIGEVKRAVPGMAILASAPTYLREFTDLYTAGAVEQGLCDGMLFGRLSFADPDFANEILTTGRIDRKHVCLTCGKCGDLIRSHKPTGCVVRDTETFLPFYREYQATIKDLPKNFRG